MNIVLYAISFSFILMAATLAIAEYDNIINLSLECACDYVIGKCDCCTCCILDGRTEVYDGLCGVFANVSMDCNYAKMSVKTDYVNERAVRTDNALLQYFNHLVACCNIVDLRVELGIYTNFVRYGREIIDVFGKIHRIFFATLNYTHIFCMTEACLQNVVEIRIYVSIICNDEIYYAFVDRINNMNCRKIVFHDNDSYKCSDFAARITGNNLLDLVCTNRSGFCDVHNYDLVRGKNKAYTGHILSVNVPQIAKNRARYYDSLVKLCMLCMYLHDISVEKTGIRELIDYYNEMYFPSVTL